MANVIFIAEDDVMVLDVYKRVFTNNGYEVQAAIDGEEAMRLLNEGKASPALILLDIMMPKAGGFEVLKFIKSKPELSNIPVMFVTNLSAPEHIKRGLEMGANKFLVKSEYSPQQIVSVIAELLATGKAPQV